MMMRKIRKYAKRLLIIVAIFIIPAFILWGAGSALRGRRSSQYAGKIFGKRISLEEYSKSWQAVRNQALMLYGQNLDKVARFLDLEQQAWERLMLLKEARRRDITVSDKEIIQTIKKLPFFQKEGKFNKDTYKTILRYVFRITPQEFEKQIKNSLIIQQLIEEVLEEVKVTEKELKKAYRKENEEVKVSYILFDTKKYEPKVKTNLNEIKNYFKEKKVEFKQPPKVKVKYISILYDKMEKEIKITPEEIKDYFASHKEEFTEGVDSKIDKKKSKSSEGKETLEENLKGEKEKVGENIEKISLTEEIRNQIKSILQEKKSRKKAETLANQVSNFLIQTPSLEKASEEFSLPIKQTDYFSINEPIPGIGWSYTFSRKAFFLEKGEISDMIKVSPKGFYFIKVIDKKEAKIPKFEEVKQEVKLKYKIHEAKKLARKEAQQKLKKLKEYLDQGVTWQTALDKANLEAKVSDFFKRGDYIKNIGYSNKFIDSSFSTPEGKLYNKIIPLRKGYCIIRTEEKKEIDEEKFEKEKEKFKQNYLASKRQQYYRNWIDQLIKKANLQSNLDELRKEAKKQRTQGK